ncbi:alpha/beta hydrolase [Acidithiobacillus marinus]|nr:alpha/beta fold hydrolase [Acidithiobacillus marinus]
MNEHIWPEGLWVRPARQENAPCIVLLHGLGASKEDLMPLSEHMDPEKQFRWVIPDAPEQAVTLNAGRKMRAWYDIYGLGQDSEEDAAGMQRMGQRLALLLDHEKADGQPLILGGFSQGGAMSLYLALHQVYPLAAVLALSAYLPLRQKLPRAQKPIPIFWGHGRSDPVLPLQYMEIAQQLLESEGYVLSTHTYPMDHHICADELADARQFLDNILLDNKVTS